MTLTYFNQMLRADAVVACGFLRGKQAWKASKSKLCSGTFWRHKMQMQFKTIAVRSRMRCPRFSSLYAVISVKGLKEWTPLIYVHMYTPPKCSLLMCSGVLLHTMILEEGPRIPQPSHVSVVPVCLKQHRVRCRMSNSSRCAL